MKEYIVSPQDKFQRQSTFLAHMRIQVQSPALQKHTELKGKKNCTLVTIPCSEYYHFYTYSGLSGAQSHQQIGILMIRQIIYAHTDCKHSGQSASYTTSTTQLQILDISIFHLMLYICICYLFDWCYISVNLVFKKKSYDIFICFYRHRHQLPSNF